MKEEIKCPKCSWKADGGAHWICSCGYVWNTFATAGKCPACGKLWTMTQCPTASGCGKYSPHLEWYFRPERALKKEQQMQHKTEKCTC